MATLTLLRGQTALIDDEDLPKVAGYRWLLSAKGYVIARVWDGLRANTVWLHRLVAGNPVGLDVDHKDRNDKLDNRKSNLRPATRRQNTGNRVKQSNGLTSKYKGVSWHSAGQGYWRAKLSFRDIANKPRHRHLGLFTDEVEAAKAYDAAAIIHFGKEFALLNFP